MIMWALLLSRLWKVWKALSNRPVLAEYPDPAVLRDLEYRSKLDLTENVRIVTIPGCDVCACCAPHVNATGEIGVIKLLSSMRHRGGIRIWMAAGQMSLEDYRTKQGNVAACQDMIRFSPLGLAHHTLA